MSGSPPRVWGQQELLVLHCSIWRFTPTCVGTTPYFRRIVSTGAVHPHVCGDNEQWPRKTGAGYGSPPRVWGQPGLVSRPCNSHRFTPTCVGTTKPMSLLTWAFAVHPHVCGDNHIFYHSRQRDGGSPPRVWGQPGDRRSTRDPFRFTPTCVGTTISSCRG